MNATRPFTFQAIDETFTLSVARGTTTERVAYVPDPILGSPTIGVLWWDETLSELFSYDFGSAFWAVVGAGGGVASVSGTAPIVSSGGLTPAISILDTAVTPGPYTNANITVDAKGRITAASSGAAGGVTSVTGSSPIASSGGATPAISIADTAVVPGSYLGANITVDAKGRLTSAADGTVASVSHGKALGRHSVGTGPAEELDLGAGLAIVGTSLNVSAATPSGVLPSGWTLVNGILINDFLASGGNSRNVSVSVPDNVSLNWRLVTQSLGGHATYTFIATLHSIWQGTSSTGYGIYLTDGTKLIGYEILNQSSAVGRLRVERMNSVTSDNATQFGPTGGLTPWTMSLRIIQDVTHRTFYHYANGAWVQDYQEAANAFLTETAVGFGGISAIGGVAAVEIDLYDWSLTF